MQQIMIQGYTLEELAAALRPLLHVTPTVVEEKPKLLSVKDLATYASVSELTVRNWIKEGKIEAKRFGRLIFIDKDQFDAGLEVVKSLKFKRN
jgi:excisionase family DNA binding protein